MNTKMIEGKVGLNNEKLQNKKQKHRRKQSPQFSHHLIKQMKKLYSVKLDYGSEMIPGTAHDILTKT